MDMSQKGPNKVTPDKVNEAYERIIEVMKETEEEDAKATYVIVKTKNMKHLSMALGNAIAKVGAEDGTAKEMLDYIKAGLDWAVENRSFPANVVPKEAARTKRGLESPRDV